MKRTWTIDLGWFITVAVVWSLTGVVATAWQESNYHSALFWGGAVVYVILHPFEMKVSRDRA